MSEAAGSSSLDRWLDAIAAREARRPSLEASLLAGRFHRYAAYRLRFVALGRGLGLLLHGVEFWILRSALGGTQLVSAVLLTSLAALLGGAWWGVLEIFRAQIRDEGLRGDELVRRVARWRALARRVGAVISVAGLAAAAVSVAGGGDDGLLLGAFALAVGLRLVLDIGVRALYSGIYATQRVFRPMTLVVAVDVAGVLVAGALIGPLGAFALPVAIVATALASRGLLYVYTRRAYAARGLSLSIADAHRAPARAPVARILSAGLAGAAMRVGPLVVVLALAAARGREHDPVLTFHVVAPLLTTAASWAQVFYLDFVRLDDTLHAGLRRRFRRALTRVGAVVSLLCAAVGAGVIAAFGLSVPLSFAAPFGLLVMVLPQLGRLQLEGFARGAFGRVALSAVGVSAVATAISASVPKLGSVEPALFGSIAGAAAGAGLMAWLLRGVAPRPRREPVAENLAAWSAGLAHCEGPLLVGRIELDGRSGRVATEVATRIARYGERRGAPSASVVVWRDRHVLWFFPRASAPSTGTLLELCAGMAVRHERLEAADGPTAQRELLRPDTALTAPLPRARAGDPPNLDALAARIRQDVPGALVWDLREPTARPPLEGTSRVRTSEHADRLGEVWRQALVLARGGRPRPRGPLAAVVVVERGAIALLVAVPRAPERDTVGKWRARAELISWRSSLPAPRPPDPPRPIALAERAPVTS